MTIDQDDDQDTTTSTDTDLDSGTSAADTASQDDNAQAVDDPSSADPNADPQTDDGSSSTNLDTTLQTADKGGQQIDWEAEKTKYEKRIADLRANQGRTANELHQYRQRFNGIDPDAARKALELSKKPEYQPWHPKSPDNRSFTAVKDSWERYKRAISNAATPEAKAAIQAGFGSTFTEKEAQQIQAWEQHKSLDQERRASDPEYEREMRREEMRQELREEMQAQREEADVAAWFSDSANQQIVERHRDEMIQLMNEGWHWPQVQRYIETKAKADGLQSRVGSAEVQSAAARAQKSALKSNAKNTRDPAQAAVGKLDFAKLGADYAKKHGLRPDHERVYKFVEQAVANWRASNPQT